MMPQPSLQSIDAYPAAADPLSSHSLGGSEDDAARALIRLIRRNPDDADAVCRLRDHYREVGDHASLANLMDGWGDRLGDAVEACTAHVEAGDAALRCGDRARAEASYGKALQRDPLHRTSLRRLVILLEEEGEHVRLCQWLKHLLHAVEARADTSRPTQRAELHEKLGDLLDRQLGRPDEAVEHYRAAFELDGERASAIAKARNMYRSAGNLQAAAILYEFEVRANDDATRKAGLLTELAQMRAEHMGDIDGGIACLRRALRLAPGDVELLYTLARLLVHRAQAREGRAQLADLKRAAELYCAAAKASSDSEDAAFYLGAALRIMPDHMKAQEMKARLSEPAPEPHAADTTDAPSAPTRVVEMSEIARLPQRGEPLAPGQSRSCSTEDPIHRATTLELPPEQVAAMWQGIELDAQEVPSWQRVKSSPNLHAEAALSPRLEEPVAFVKRVSDPSPPRQSSVPPPPPPAGNAAYLGPTPNPAGTPSAETSHDRLPDAPAAEASDSSQPQQEPATAQAPDEGTIPLEPLLDEAVHVEEAEPLDEEAPSPSAPAQPRSVAPISVARPVAHIVDVLPTGSGLPEMEVNLGATTESNLYVGLDANLQSGGVFAVTYEPWPVDAEIHLLITLPGGFEAQARGKVEYLRGSPTSSDGARPGVGIRFLEITAQDLALLHRFMAKRPPIYLDS